MSAERGAPDPVFSLERLAQFDSIEDLIRAACQARDTPLQHLDFVMTGTPRGHVLRYADGRIVVGGEAPPEKPLSRDHAGKQHRTAIG